MTLGVGVSTMAAELADLSPRAGRPPAITAAEYEARLEKARGLTRALGADALLIGAGASLRYFTGVPWGATERLVALLLPVSGAPLMICPGFELGSLQADLKIEVEIRLWQEHESPAALVARCLAEVGVDTLALDPAAPFLLYSSLKSVAPSLSVKDATAVVDGCRGVKSPAELALMRYAKAITLDVHRRAGAVLAPGVRASEVKRFIDEAHRAAGTTGSTFCAVQFGEATAYPHGLPGDQELAQGDLVLIDTGCQVEGYQADITRTYVFGEPDAEHRRIWEIEHAAQAAAFDAVKPGLPCEVIDQVARQVLERHGLGPDYALPGLPHRTGHGIGLSIHEGPYLVRGDSTPLAPGMCFSNEPMIVVPGRFGVRLEDHFHVTEDGAAWFTPPSPSIDDPFGLER
ncbi:X-Pro dipeptidase [Caulobacter sp. D4A]|uniref:M24 family metallopeptidase n=1 Tax=unclassified Caulobacter TaxID=2648921 RepID=UPI000D735A6A|nr:MULTISPECIES: Xaa-Pro peptidase family protein [unclassified Caulobacter]PXA87918.1 X-Pro dipeptidase [Caulobacter sp. D4A]PXA88165.1 X-Pro dipeptidase [Caulobacter sp. D5]